MHRPTRRAAISATAAALFATTSACTETRQSAAEPSPGEAFPEGWSTLPPAPGPARVGALTAWTGEHAVFLGGHPSVPLVADGFSSSLTPASDVRHRDGIAFTPGTNSAAGTWRTLPDAPVPSFDASSGAAVIDGSVYFLAPRALLQFDTTSDTWTQHEIPEFTGNWLHAAGDRLILTAAGVEDVPDYQWDPRRQQWSTVATDPLGRAGRRAINTPHGFLLIAADPDHPRDDNGPRPLAAALLDVDTGTWRRLPDYRQLEGGQLALSGDEGDRVIDVTPLGGYTVTSGPDVGTRQPASGALTLPEGTWSALPGAEAALTPGWWIEATGHALVATQGLLYDDRKRTWAPLVPPPGRSAADPGSAVWAGDALIVLGSSSGGDAPELGSAEVDTTVRAYRPAAQ